MAGKLASSIGADERVAFRIDLGGCLALLLGIVVFGDAEPIRSNDIPDCAHANYLLGKAHDQTGHWSATGGAKELFFGGISELDDSGLADHVLLVGLELRGDVEFCKIFFS